MSNRKIYSSFFLFYFIIFLYVVLLFVTSSSSFASFLSPFKFKGKEESSFFFIVLLCPPTSRCCHCVVLGFLFFIYARAMYRSRGYTLFFLKTLSFSCPRVIYKLSWYVLEAVWLHIHLCADTSPSPFRVQHYILHYIFTISILGMLERPNSIYRTLRLFYWIRKWNNGVKQKVSHKQITLFCTPYKEEQWKEIERK